MRTESKLSVYESIVERIKRDIALGIIAQGEKLPSCRELAMEMGVNPNTVQRAYTALEEQGIIYTIPKKGVYASDSKGQGVFESAEEEIRRLKAAGIAKEQLQQIIEKIFAEGNHD